MDVTQLARRRLSVIFGRDLALLSDEQKLRDLATSTGRDGWVESDFDLVGEDLAEALGTEQGWDIEAVTVADYCRALTDYAARDPVRFQELSMSWSTVASLEERSKKRLSVMWGTTLFVLFFIVLFIVSKFFSR